MDTWHHLETRFAQLAATDYYYSLFTKQGVIT